MKIKKRNTYGVVPHATYKPRVARYARQPWAIKSGRLWDSSLS
ncbi:hypothetical protein [Segatella salivae]|nr:hypothetical protein [Segatella salivae]